MSSKATTLIQSLNSVKNILFISLLIPFFSFGQELSFLSYNLNPIQQSVQLVWQVSAGNSCQNVELQHSLNGKDFETFFTYVGVCGNPNAITSYDHTHQNPTTNKINYYRLKVNQDLTDVKTVFITGADEIIVLPHPVKETSQIIFNGSGNAAQVTVYNLNGGIIWQEHFDQEPVLINATEFNSGFYILQVNDNGQILTRKILVL